MTYLGGLAQLARAPALQAGGQRFESVILHIASSMKQEIFDILNTQHEVLMMCVNDVNEFTRLRVYETHNTPK